VTLRTILIVLLALVFGASAAVGVGNLRNRDPEAAKNETVPVVVAAADVPRFVSMTADHLTVRDCPKDLVPPGALTSIDEAVNRITLNPVARGETLLDSRLAPRGSGRGMGPGIARGKRAFTIQTPNVASGVAGFILPGSKVDVLLTVSGYGANDTTGGGSTITLLQNVEILAVDQRVDAPAENKVDAKELRSVTLLVTPEEATKLDLGQNKGALHLSLRNPEDEQHVHATRATLADIGLVERVKEAPKDATTQAAPPKAVPVTPAQIRTLRGTSEGYIEFIAPDGTHGNR
jgi:pilus assembly protein CpaB